MRLKCICYIMVAMMSSSAALAGPVTLSNSDLDRVTAGDLVLPNDRTVLGGFDNAAPGDFHPALTQPNGSAVDATFGIVPSGDPAEGFSGSNEGPWSAHFMSPVIDMVP